MSRTLRLDPTPGCPSSPPRVAAGHHAASGCPKSWAIRSERRRSRPKPPHGQPVARKQPWRLEAREGPAPSPKNRPMPPRHPNPPGTSTEQRVAPPGDPCAPNAPPSIPSAPAPSPGPSPRGAGTQIWHPPAGAHLCRGTLWDPELQHRWPSPPRARQPRYREKPEGRRGLHPACTSPPGRAGNTAAVSESPAGEGRHAASGGS